MTGTRWCERCGKNRALRFFKPRGRVCLPCQKAGRKVQVRHFHVQKTYGLTIKQYEALKEYQGGRCGACGETRQGNLCVDHDHKTGLVRGLLCRRCNRVLGLIRDIPETAQGLHDYLLRPAAVLLGIQVKVDPAVAERPRGRWNRG